MRHHRAVAGLLPLCVLALAFLLGGCQKAVKGPELANVLYTTRHVMVRVTPDPGATVLVSLGPNVQVVATDYANGFTRVDIDGGRINGWVENDALGTTTVRERAPRRASAPAKPRGNRPEAKPDGQAAQAPAATDQAAPPADAPQAAPAAAATPEPQAPAAQPAKAAPQGGGLLSPAEAQAATPPADTPKAKAAPAKPAPAKGKQARPEAFDPF